MRRIWEKFMSLLRVRQSAAGLEVSDEVLRLACSGGKGWRTYAVRLAPGTVSGGKILDRASFLAALVELKEKACGGRRTRKKISVVACLSSAEIYLQTLSLPAVPQKELVQAVALNMAMAAPLDANKLYSGWEFLGTDEATGQVKILAVFIGREAADGVAGALFEAGFLPMAMESRSLAFARMLRAGNTGIDREKTYLAIDIGNTGMNFLIIKSGVLAFEYVEPWKNVMGEKGEVSAPRFKEALEADIRRVMNFYRQHWSAPLGGAILAAPAFADLAAEAATEAAPGVPVSRLTLVMGEPVSPEWLAALGTGLRSTEEGSAHEVNLLGAASEERFHEEQLSDFLRFWRVAVPAAFGILILTFGIADIFLHGTRNGIESRAGLTIAATDQAQMQPLAASAAAFNRSVALVGAAEQEIRPKSALIAAAMAAAATNHISIDHMTFRASDTPVSLSGSGLSQDDVVAFKTALDTIPGVSGVNLPLEGIQTGNNSVSFSLSFSYVPQAPASPASPVPAATPATGVTTAPAAAATSAGLQAPAAATGTTPATATVPGAP